MNSPQPHRSVALARVALSVALVLGLVLWGCGEDEEDACASVWEEFQDEVWGAIDNWGDWIATVPEFDGRPLDVSYEVGQAYLEAHDLMLGTGDFLEATRRVGDSDGELEPAEVRTTALAVAANWRATADLALAADAVSVELGLSRYEDLGGPDGLLSRTSVGTLAILQACGTEGS